VAAFKAIDCAGMARVDFFLEDHGPLLLNEINTIPGFTATSGYARMWEASGLDYVTLVNPPHRPRPRTPPGWPGTNVVRVEAVRTAETSGEMTGNRRCEPRPSDGRDER